VNISEVFLVLRLSIVHVVGESKFLVRPTFMLPVMKKQKKLIVNL